MPVKTQQRIPNETVRMRGRTNTMTTTTSKVSIATSKRTGGGIRAGKPRINSDTPTTSSDNTSINARIDLPIQVQVPLPIKVITEVDDTNIEEVLSLSDFSLIPRSFLTEIQEDQIYETILEELQKKLPHKLASKAFLPQGADDDDDEQRKLFSPHLFAIDDDNNDDNLSITDEIPSAASSSSSSSETNEQPSHDDYDTDIEPEPVTEEKHDPSGREQYRELCQQSKSVPCSYFLAHIQDERLVLRYIQFNTDDIRAITKTLISNFSVESLCLDGNFLQQQAAKYITRLVLKNDFITELSLANNRLGGGEGTKEICRMVSLNRRLTKINLSGNKFNELDIIPLVDALEQNKILLELDLSHNCFGEECGKILGTFIGTNDSLDSIDLSWNNFRGRSAIDLINGIKDNGRLKFCNVGMNGFGPIAGQVLADCIKQNTNLEEFNISGNRLNTTNAFAIAQALSSNDTLQVLKIGNNQINCDGVLAIFLCIKANVANKLREVDFSNTVVTQETVNVCEDIVKLKGGQFQYHIGDVIPEKLQANSTSELYLKTNEEFLNKLRTTAANVKLDIS